MQRTTVIIFIILSSFLIVGSCKKDSKPVTYEKFKLFPQIRSIVQQNCTISCHAPSMGFTDGLPVILEGDTSIVYHASGIKSSVADPVTITNKRMPAGGLLTDKEVELIKNWYMYGGTSDI